MSQLKQKSINLITDTFPEIQTIYDETLSQTKVNWFKLFEKMELMDNTVPSAVFERA